MCYRRWRTLTSLGLNPNNTNKLCITLAVNYKRYDLFIGNVLTKPHASNTLMTDWLWLRWWLWRSTVGGLDSFGAAPIFTVPHWWTCTTNCLPNLLKFFLFLILFGAIFITGLRICNLFNDSLREWTDAFLYELWEFRARLLKTISRFYHTHTVPTYATGICIDLLTHLVRLDIHMYIYKNPDKIMDKGIASK